LQQLRSGVAAKGVGLRVPVKSAGARSIVLKMMLGALMVASNKVHHPILSQGTDVAEGR